MATLDPSLIADLPPFAGIPRGDLASFIARAHSRFFKKGTYIFREDEDAHSFLVLLDGYIRVIRVSPHGEQVIMRFIASGELFGIAAAIGRDTYPANAVAAVDCLALAWPTTSWDDVVSRYPAFATNTHKVVGDRLIDTQDKIVEFVTERVEQRVANAIIKLADQSGRKTDQGILIDFPISRQEISEMTGTTLHTVSRLMSAWESEGWVKSSRRKIVLVEGNKLKMVARTRN